MNISGLLDPKWIEERNRQIQERTDQEEVFAGSSIESSLKHLAERRTDIFGAGTEEAGIGKKVNFLLDKLLIYEVSLHIIKK
jgi:splicing factor 3A subunit 1